MSNVIWDLVLYLPSEDLTLYEYVLVQFRSSTYKPYSHYTPVRKNHIHITLQYVKTIFTLHYSTLSLAGSQFQSKAQWINARYWKLNLGNIEYICSEIFEV